LSLWHFVYKAEQDYRRVAPWARRVDRTWLHQENSLVAQVERYLEGHGIK
jgi:hypothetical protein